MVRVDSPGGSVLASERIRQAILEAKANKIPVVVSMGSVAASGGYWVSTPADFIYAEPSTITGSIGVFGIIPSFQGTLQKLGIGADGVKTTPLSGEPDVLKGPSPEAEQLIQTGVESIYGRFLGIVARRATRPRSRSTRSRRAACGTAEPRTSSASSTGSAGSYDAVAKAAELAGLGNERGVRYLEPPLSFREQLIETLASTRKTTTAPFPRTRSRRSRARRSSSSPRCSARCARSCPGQASRRAVSNAAGRPGARQRDSAALLKAWLPARR